MAEHMLVGTTDSAAHDAPDLFSYLHSGGPVSRQRGLPQNFVLDATSTHENGRPVHLMERRDNLNQRWVFDAGLFQVRLAGTNFCLDSPSRGNGGEIHPWACSVTNVNQQWGRVGGTLRLRNTNYCLDNQGDTNSNKVSGNGIQLWGCVSASSYYLPNQEWEVELP